MYIFVFYFYERNKFNVEIAAFYYVGFVVRFVRTDEWVEFEALLKSTIRYKRWRQRYKLITKNIVIYGLPFFYWKKIVSWLLNWVFFAD